jgi:glycosyltransferase involved in cell wall biosynthesis
MTGRVLVVNHEASLSGAPRVALDVVKALRAGGAEVILVHRRGGPFRAEMDRAASRSRREPLAPVRAALRGVRGLRPLANRLEAFSARRVVRRERPDLVWANTVLSAAYVVAARQAGVPVVFHSHEPPSFMAEILVRHHLVDAPEAMRGVTLVGCSPETSAGLAAVTGVAPDRVTTLRSAVDVRSIAAERAPRAERADDDSVTLEVVGCGADPLRKGLDLFATVATLVDRQRPGATRFVWIGKASPAATADSLVRTLGMLPDARARIAAADIFVLTSRDDPFPLVVMEAMAASRPIVAFAVGGVPEQLGDAGLVVRPEDVAGMAAAVVALVDLPAERERLGVAAFERVRAYWDAGTFADGVWDIARRAMPGA